MNEIQIFKNDQFGEIRTLVENGEILFCGNDVAKALGYQNPSRDVQRHCKNAILRCTTDSVGRQQDMLFIPESDLYRLVFSSKLPTAEEFTDWVAEEVLPTIRKTGGYVNDESAFVNTYLPFADDSTKALFGQTLAALRAANNKIEADKPKVLFADAVSTAHTSILIGELAKLLKQNGVEIGQNRLFKWMRDNGYLIKRQGTDFNMPTQKAMDLGLFEIKETAISHADGHTSVNKTPKVTGKGQQYFVNLFLNH